MRQTKTIKLCNKLCAGNQLKNLCHAVEDHTHLLLLGAYKNVIVICIIIPIIQT